MEAIDEAYGTLEVKKIDWSGIDGVKISTEIEMEPCDNLKVNELTITTAYSRKRLGLSEG